MFVSVLNLSDSTNWFADVFETFAVTLAVNPIISAFAEFMFGARQNVNENKNKQKISIFFIKNSKKCMIFVFLIIFYKNSIH